MSAAPLLFVLIMWFIGTGAVVWLVSRPRGTYPASLCLLGFAALAAIGFVWARAGDASVGAAYAGFAAAIIVWGWHEASFLMGAVAGPSRQPCPEGAIGWVRFRAAAATLIHHEIAIALTAAALFGLTWGQPNQAAPFTFLLLFALRLSAKFNLFLGVPNLSDEVFPSHLAHLKSYFRVRTLNSLFPFSIAGSGGLAVWAWLAAGAAPAQSGAAATATLIAGLAALGVVEHLFLVLPLRDARMWRWATAAPAAATK